MNESESCQSGVSNPFFIAAPGILKISSELLRSRPKYDRLERKPELSAGGSGWETWRNRTAERKRESRTAVRDRRTDEE